MGWAAAVLAAGARADDRRSANQIELCLAFQSEGRDDDFLCFCPELQDNGAGHFSLLDA